ncbi:FUSC family protein [Paraburkholderia sp. 2C]
MKGAARQTGDGFRLAGFLRSEMRVYPGRANVMLRTLLSSAIVIVASMALQVPLLALSLIAVFYVTQANVVVTRLIGILFFVGSTLAIGVTIVLLKFTYAYPLVRIVAVGLMFFACVYLMRVMKIGVVFFIVGIVVIYGQSFVDQTDQPERVVRSLLWVWVAINYAIALTLVINTLFLPAEPARQLKGAMLSQLKAVDDALADFEQHVSAPRRPGARDVETGTLALQKLLRFATMREARYRRHQTAMLAEVTTVSRLYAAAGYLPLAAEGVGAGVVAGLRSACRAFGEAVERGEPFAPATGPDGASREALPGALREMRSALLACAGRASTPEAGESTTERQRLLLPDASSNPVYAQFALKTLLAAMLGYVFYLATDWQGIHTIMLTCLIVAQPSLGATGQRAVLRIGGAAAGSILALAMVVWIVPHLHGIVGLLMMVLPVIALGAWLAAGSERIAYAGVQMMFTFSLALLEQFGPSTHLTEIRDRMVGIMLGVVLSAVIHATLWPEVEGEALRQRVGTLLRRLAASLRPQVREPALAALWTELGDCETIAARVALEPTWQIGEGQHEDFTIRMQALLAQIREIVAAAIAFEAEVETVERTSRTAAASDGLQQALATLLDTYADRLTNAARPVQASPAPSLAGLAAACAADSAQADSASVRLMRTRILSAAETLAVRVADLPAAPPGSRTGSFPESGPRQ